MFACSLEFWSDLSGLAGSIALLVTAWRNDGLYGFVDRLRKSVDHAKKQADRPAQDKLAIPIIESLDAELRKWSWLDRWSLRVGAGLLIFSFVLKLAGRA